MCRYLVMFPFLIQHWFKTYKRLKRVNSLISTVNGLYSYFNNLNALCFALSIQIKYFTISHHFSVTELSCKTNICRLN